jgi:hypothetical protein
VSGGFCREELIETRSWQGKAAVGAIWRLRRLCAAAAAAAATGGLRGGGGDSRAAGYLDYLFECFGFFFNFPKLCLLLTPFQNMLNIFFAKIKSYKFDQVYTVVKNHNNKCT